MFRKLLFIVLVFMSLSSAAQDTIQPIKMVTPVGAKEKFNQFIKKDKFGIDNKLTYKGIRNGVLRSSLSKKVNLLAKDFIQVSSEEVPTDLSYQQKIMYGLERFKENKKELLKEDRARICHYIIELMDIIDLKSSRGLLNMFTYGFDPSTLDLDALEKK